MASLFRPSYTKSDPITGGRISRKVRKWYGKYRDASGRLRCTPFSPNKTAAMAILTDLERKIELQKASLVDPCADYVMGRIEDHLGDFEKHLEAKMRSLRHKSETIRVIQKVALACELLVLADLQNAGERLEHHLADRRRDGISHWTINGDIVAVRSFCRWLVHRRRMHEGDVFQGPAFREGLFYQMVFSERSAGLLERYRNAVASNMTFLELDELAKQSPPGARGLRLHPDAFHRDTRKMFEHKQRFHSLGDDVRAILEGVAVELSRQLHLLCGGDLPTVVHAAGGAARSKLWLEIKSRTLNFPVVPVNCPEPIALGAALLAISYCRQIPLEDLTKELGLRHEKS